MNTAITGSSVPIKNHFIGERPMRFAKAAVMSGMLKRMVRPSEIKRTAPMEGSGIKWSLVVHLELTKWNQVAGIYF